MPTVEEMRAELKKGSPPEMPSIAQMRADLKSGQAPDPDILQEQHPDLSYFTERFPIKNFGDDAQSSIEFLKRNHPQMDIRQFNGQIIMKNPGETQYRVLDPSYLGAGGFLGKAGEALKDVGDVAYDTAAGFGSGLAATGAGVGAAALTGGAGALPAAAAAGGSTGAGLEYLRQKLGGSMGVGPKETNGLQIGIAGGLGAVAPLAFGTGASAKTIAKVAGNEGVGQTLLGTVGRATGEAMTDAQKAEAIKILGDSQKGMLKFSSNVGSGITGVPKQTIEVANEQAPEAVKREFGLRGKDLTNLQASDIMEKRGFTDVIERASTTVLQKLRRFKEGLQGEYEGALQKVDGIDAQEFRRPFEKLAKTLDDSGLQNDITKDQLAAVNSKIQDTFTRQVTRMTPEGKEISERVPITVLNGKDAMMLKQQLKDMTDNFANMDLKDSAKKSVVKAATDAYYDLGSVLDRKMTEVGNPALTKAYKAHMEVEKFLEPVFEDPNKAFAFFRNGNNQSKRFIRDKIRGFDKTYNLGIGDMTDLMDTWSVFASPSWTPISSKAGTSTSKSLNSGEVGAGLMRALFPSIPGASSAGRVGASALSSPALMKKGLQIENLLSRAGKKTKISDLLDSLQRPAAMSSAPMSAWNALNNRGEK